MAKWQWMKKDRTVFWKDCPKCRTPNGMHLNIYQKKWKCQTCGYEVEEAELNLLKDYLLIYTL